MVGERDKRPVPPFILTDWSLPR